MTGKINNLIGNIASVLPKRNTNEKVPIELQEKIAEYLSPADKAAAQRVNPSWKAYISPLLPKNVEIGERARGIDKGELERTVKFCKRHGIKITKAWLEQNGRVGQANKDGLQYLVNLPLKELDLSGSTNISNLDLRRISHLPLCKLDLSRCDISDWGLRFLRTLPLRELSLSGCEITGDGLKHIVQLPSLVYLNLSRTNITDKDLQKIARLPLIYLNLKACENITNPEEIGFLIPQYNYFIPVSDYIGTLLPKKANDIVMEYLTPIVKREPGLSLPKSEWLENYTKTEYFHL
jgi:Leucine Rich repeat